MRFTLLLFCGPRLYSSILFFIFYFSFHSSSSLLLLPQNQRLACVTLSLPDFDSEPQPCSAAESSLLQPMRQHSLIPELHALDYYYLTSLTSSWRHFSPTSATNAQDQEFQDLTDQSS